MANSLAKSRRLCAAPMMRFSHRHARYFWRTLSRASLLYTEMLTADAVLRGEKNRLLAFDSAEKPLALQLAGADPAKLANAAKIGEEWGYDEINLNAGCPSPRVRRGEFGACLMARPQLVGECVAAMRSATRLPVTVKCRIAIDEMDSESCLNNFAKAVWESGGDALIVHARRAWLGGLNPRENRSKPPLDYARVYQLKRDFPKLAIIINGGIDDAYSARLHLEKVDGAMLGRAAAYRPYAFAQIAGGIHGDPPPPRTDAIAKMLEYCARRIAEESAVNWRRILSPLWGLYHGEPHARIFRRALANAAEFKGAFAALSAAGFRAR